MKKYIIENGKIVAEVGQAKDFITPTTPILVSGPNVPKSKSINEYTVIEHDTGTKYTVTEYQKPKPPMSVQEMSKIVKDLESNRVKPKSKRDIELEQSKKYWNQYYKDNQGKIPNKFPRNIFHKDE